MSASESILSTRSDGNPSKSAWHQAFDKSGDQVTYADWLDDTQQKQLGVRIEQELMELVDDVIFANTFFALEETGLAYPSISRESGVAVDRLDAWLRVFASATRVQENKFFNDARTTEWDTATKVPPTNRVRKFAEAYPRCRRHFRDSMPCSMPSARPVT